MSLFESIQSQMPADAAAQLERIDAFWHRYRHEDKAITSVIHDCSDQSVEQSVEPSGTDNQKEIEFDAIVSGGTLGIFIACALQRKGWRVMVIEQGILRGRVQEWNISRRELNTFLELDLLTESELETAIATTYNPARVGFAGGKDLWVRDILNIGVDPIYLLEILKQKFLAAGGTLWEKTKFDSAQIYKNGVIVTVEREQEKEQVTGRLLLDVMGHFSPIVQQARSLSLTEPKRSSQNLKPDGICMVVGSCAQGIPEKSHGDLIYSFTPIQNHCQYFWEAFPARDGRTTYMFTYVDAEGDRPSFSQLMEDYLFWLPQYQEVELEKIQFQRILMGFFPSYRQSPVQTPWDRVLQVGDSSGMQSPLSFGGFGAMVRHLPRLTAGLDMALAGDWLRKSDLRSLQPYQPNISVTWLFQKSMSVALDQQLESSQERDRINYLLNVTFTAMQKLGDRVLYPFLQDVVQFVPLAQTMIAMAIADPVLVLKIVRQVGIGTLLDWLQHYLGLGLYSLLNQLAQNLQSTTTNLLPEQQYKLQRQIDQWYYGSGGDWGL